MDQARRAPASTESTALPTSTTTTTATTATSASQQPQNQNRRRVAAADETLQLLHDVSQLLNTGLTREQLRICVDLVEAGENPEAVAAVVKELRKEAAAL